MSKSLILKLIIGQYFRYIFSDIIWDKIKELEYENYDYNQLKFQKDPLKNFYKIHYSKPRHLLKNIGNTTGFAFNKTSKNLFMILKNLFRK